VNMVEARSRLSTTSSRLVVVVPVAAKADSTSGSCRIDCSRAMGIDGRMLRLDGARDGVCNLEEDGVVDSSVVIDDDANWHLWKYELAPLKFATAPLPIVDLLLKIILQRILRLGSVVLPTLVWRKRLVVGTNNDNGRVFIIVVVFFDRGLNNYYR